MTEMKYYRQTVLMPLPKQELSDKDWYRNSRNPGRYDNKRKEQINSIVAYFK